MQWAIREKVLDGIWCGRQKIESGEMLITEGPIGREECASFQSRSETLLL